MKQDLMTGYSLSAVAARILLEYHTGSLNVTGGLVDLGGKVRSAQGSAYSLPTSLKLAADYTFAWEQVSLQGALDADYYFSGHYCVAAGVNLGLGGIGFLRGGYRYASPQAVLPSGLGLGGGVQFKGVTLDLAVMTASPTLSGTWMAGIGYRF